MTCAYKYSCSVDSSAGWAARLCLALLIALPLLGGCKKDGGSTSAPPPREDQATQEENKTTTEVQPDTEPKENEEPVEAVTAKADLPPAEEIIERYIEVTGGRAAYEKLHNMVLRGTISITASGQSVGVTMYKASPNKHLQILESEGVLTFRQGFDGETLWQMNRDNVARIFDGPSKVAQVNEETFNAELRLPELHEGVYMVKIEEMSGEPCYHLLLTSPQVAAQHRFYSVESGLLVARRVVQPGPRGGLSMLVEFSDYEETAGVRFPRRFRKTQMGQEMITIMDSVEVNVDLPADIFDLPEEVQVALEEKQAEAGGVPTSQPAGQESDPPSTPAADSEEQP